MKDLKTGVSARNKKIVKKINQIPRKLVLVVYTSAFVLDKAWWKEKAVKLRFMKSTCEKFEEIEKLAQKKHFLFVWQVQTHKYE